MTYVVALLATRWGSELGGLNVFNTGLAKAMPSVLTKHSRTLCFVENIAPEGAMTPERVELRLLEWDPSKLAAQLAAVCRELIPKSLQGVLVVGHDAKTGRLAIDCAKQLTTQIAGATSAESAAISHMDYSEYSGKKGKALEHVTISHKTQKDVVLDADYAYAVGPLLTANFSSARGVKRGRTSPVRRLIPGAADIRSQRIDTRVGLQFFISGRLNHEDDPIKNGILSVHALVRAFRERRAQGDERWSGRGRLIACGVDVEHDSQIIEALKRMASADAGFEIEAAQFSADQAPMYNHLAASHIALMPSWHEGFGLSGWEALCAGVPLLCSRQSGLAMFLEELKITRPGLSLDSVEFLNFAGSNQAGQPSDEDIELFAGAIERMVANLAHRKEEAIKLARALKSEFTWKRCASDLLDSVKGWYLPGSVHWSARQRFASDAVHEDGSLQEPEEVLERVKDRLDQLSITDDWQDLTTAFNYLSDLGKESKRIRRSEHRRQLGEIGIAASKLLDATSEMPAVRETGVIDICWRYMAASSAIADEFGDFVALFPASMLSTIWSDSFLSREMLHYAKPFADEFDGRADNLVASFFEPLRKAAAANATIAPRIARLASSSPTFANLVDGLRTSNAYQQEELRCDAANRSAHDVAVEAARDPSLVATVLAQMALRADPARQVADQALAFIKAYYPGVDRVEGHWRGDKRLSAALTTANLPTGAVLPALQNMATDEDESIRWAALHLAFSPILRTRLEASIRAGDIEPKFSLNEVLGKVVDDAVRFDSGHPWLCREFLLHFQREWDHRSAARSQDRPTNFTLLDFPVSRWLFGPVIGEEDPILNGAQHPEVRYVRETAQESVRRVLLVLPPIELVADATAASSTSSPPLGLGLLATHLASQGHDVQIADCHRSPALADQVIRLSLTFDLVGFNVVFTTVKATVGMLTEIRNRSARAVLAIGGPAAKLRAWKNAVGQSDEHVGCWDFAISERAEDNLTLLVNSLRLDAPWPNAIGLEANRYSLTLKHRDLEDETDGKRGQGVNRQHEWKEIAVDRRVFRTKGRQYEPSKTRAYKSEVHEAHVVMSQGCDWNCVFCTERSSVSGGENRRPVDHVILEIGRLAKDYPHLNVQFIDDNLLPQIATFSASDSVRRHTAIAWATSFFEELARIRSRTSGSFGWRGIFRLEDFFTYEEAFGRDRFFELLSQSGCRMLAFGIEHGDENQRAKIKVGSRPIANSEISSLFERLFQADILTKAYFILGGRWETEESALKTVEFAIGSGVTLAYFALYKDFSRAAQALMKHHVRGDKSAEAFLEYRQLAIDWDAAFSEEDSSIAQGATSGSLVTPATNEERVCYRHLASLGFRFFDVIKYNDFHSDEGPSGVLLREVTWSSPKDYFSIVEQAYRRFYLRPQFVEDYKLLLTHGY